MIVLMLFATLIFPFAQPVSSISDSNTIEDISYTENQGPTAIPVAPISPEIEYSGDPGGAYMPEPQYAPTGPQTLIVILVYFSDLSNTESSSTINSIIFSNVSDYYDEVSYGQSSISGAVAGWYNIGGTKASYGADGATSGAIDDTNDDGSNDSWRLVDAALAVADPYVDFSLYGHIMVVHAGNGQESSGVSTDIWSVRWSWPGHFSTDEKTFDSCSIVPEFQGGDVDRSIGVIAHEFGHDIGLPDLYHYGKTGSDDLVGMWGLMASGSWGGSPSGTVPVHMTAYSKLMLDWYADGEVYDLTSGTYEATLTSSYNQTSGLRVIRYNVSSTYYYLVEARYQAGYDASVYENGILITRVDTTKGSGQGIVQVRADSISSLYYGAWAPGQEFVDEISSFAVEVLAQEGTSFRVRVRTDPLDGWLDGSSLSGTSHNDYKSPVMATDSAGTIYCAYSVWNSSISQYSILAKYSDDGGLSWITAFSFYNSSYSYINPSIAIDPNDDSIFIAYESTDGSSHDVGIARYYSDHNLWSIDIVSVDARDPSIAIDYVYGASNRVMMVFEAWNDDVSSAIEIVLSTNHGNSWSTQQSFGIDTFNVEPQIVVSYGFDGTDRWHVVFVGGNTISNITKIVAARSSDYYGAYNGWTTTFTTTISNPTVAAPRGVQEVIFAWTVNSYELTPSYQHDIYMWYSNDHAESVTSNLALMSTTDDEKYPVFAADNQGSSRYEKGVVILSYFNGDDVCVRRLYYDRPNVIGDEEVLSTTGYDVAGGIGVTTHYISSTVGRFYPVVAWMNDTTSHEILCAVPGYYKEFGASSPGYTITVNGVDYTCPVTIGLMFGFTYDIKVGDYHIVSSDERMRYESWESLPDGLDVGSQNYTIIVNRFDTGYDLLSTTEYYLTVTSAYGTASGSGWYDSGTNAFASLDTGVVAGSTGTQYVFTAWSGDASGTDYSSSNSITMDSPKTTTATWKTQYYLTVESDHGTAGGEGWYDSGSSATASVDSGVIAGSTGTQYVFTSWGDDATGSDYSGSDSITMDGSKTATASWKTQYYLTVSSDHGTTGGEGWYDAGESTAASIDSGVIAGSTGTQYVFTSWGDDATGTVYSGSDSITMDGPKTATANWKTQYYLTVDSDHGTIGGEGWYDSATSGIASVDSGVIAGSTGTQYVFTSWTDDATGSDYSASDSITIDGPKTATAVWTTQYFLTVNSAYASTGGEGWHDSGSTVSVSVDTNPVAGSTGTQYVFTSWGDDATGSDYSGSNSITMDGPKTATANWKTQYYLTVNTDHGTAGGEGWYDSSVSAVGSIDSGVIAGSTGTQYVFTSWTGDATGSDYSGSDAITMDGPKTATAVWETQHYLTVSTSYGSQGGDGWYVEGATPTAAVDAGVVAGGTGTQYVFTSWGDDATGSNYAASDAITMDGPKTATANWKTQYYLIVTSDHANAGGEGWYDSSTSTVATLDAGTIAGDTGIQYVFTSWTGDVSGTDYSGSDTITMDGPKTATANWETQYYLAVNTPQGNPGGDGWYAADIGAFASIDTGFVSLGTGVQYGFTSWSGDASGTDYTSSDPITMDGPKTATAIWQTQYYLNISTDHGTGGEGWFNADSYAYASLDSGVIAGSTGTQYVFTTWTGDATGTDYSTSDSILMDGPKEAVANWKTQYFLTVDSAHGTTGGDGWYDSGTSAFASVDSGVVAGDTGTQYIFSSWGGDGSGSDHAASEAITMDGPKTTTANWETQYYLDISSAYGTTSGSGWYTADSTAIAGLDRDTHTTVIGIRYTFVRWGGDATGTDYSQSDDILMDEPKYVTAILQTEFYLTIESDHADTSGEGWYINGSTTYASVNASLIATGSGTRYIFTDWSGDTTGTDYSSSEAIVMDGPKTAVANWMTQYQLIYTTEPAELTPQPTISPLGIWFNATTNVTLTAGEVAGYAFEHWMVDNVILDEGLLLITITMDEAHVAVAVYSEETTTVTTVTTTTSTTTTATTTTETTSPTDPTTTEDPLAGMIVLTIGFVGAVVGIIVIIIIMKKKG
jgi:M6 family metalloprotease-like protein